MKNIFCRLLKRIGITKANVQHWEKPKEIKGMSLKAVAKKQKKYAKSK